MAYKLLALDIDDTLLDKSGELTDKVRCAVHKARDNGVEIVIATGRMHRSSRPIAEKLGMADAAYICFAGSQIYRGDELLYSDYLPSDLADEVLEWAYSEGLSALCYVWDSYVFEIKNEHTDAYAGRMDVPGIQIPALRQFGRIQTPKVLVVGEPERLAGFVGPLGKRFEGRLQVARSMPNFLEFNTIRSNKGTALARYAEMQGLMADECIAVGDSPIDISMIKWAGLGVAMGNAADEVKEAADIIAPGCDEDGVAWVVEQFLP